MRVTWAAVRRWRLSQQYLLGGATDAVEVVGRLTAIPAWSGDPELAVAVRLAAPTDGILRQSLNDGALIRTYAFRGSTHLMRPVDASAILAVRAAGRQWELKSWQDHYQLTREDWPELRAAVREALRRGPLTQVELSEIVTRPPRFAHLRSAFTAATQTFLKPFAWQGDLFLGPSREGKVTLCGFDQLPGWKGLLELDQAGHQAILDYLMAYGPATSGHLQYWFGEGLSAGRRRIERWTEELGDRITSIDVEGDSAYCLPEHATEIAATQPDGRVHLLPGLDQWVLGPGTADTHIVPADLRPLVTRGANLVLYDGLVAGTWTIQKTAVAVAVSNEGRIPPTTLSDPAERVATLMHRPNMDIDIQT